MTRPLSLALGFAVLAAIAGGAVALQNESAAPVSTAAPAAPKLSPKAAATADAPPVQGSETPMADRVAVIGLLNKRNGLSRDLTMKPGQALRAGNVIVRLRACETTAPWETQTLTGAFVQVDRLGVENQWRRVFSGWLYKESPSLNVVEHPVYDVWPKSCVMTYPSGPAVPKAPASSSNLSSARKSAGPSATGARPSTSAGGTPLAAAPPPSAAESNAT